MSSFNKFLLFDKGIAKVNVIKISFYLENMWVFDINIKIIKIWFGRKTKQDLEWTSQALDTVLSWFTKSRLWRIYEVLQEFWCKVVWVLWKMHLYHLSEARVYAKPMSCTNNHRFRCHLNIIITKAIINITCLHSSTKYE